MRSVGRQSAGFGFKENITWIVVTGRNIRKVDFFTLVRVGYISDRHGGMQTGAPVSYAR